MALTHGQPDSSPRPRPHSAGHGEHELESAEYAVPESVARGEHKRTKSVSFADSVPGSNLSETLTYNEKEPPAVCGKDAPLLRYLSRLFLPFPFTYSVHEPNLWHNCDCMSVFALVVLWHILGAFLLFSRFCAHVQTRKPTHPHGRRYASTKRAL